MRLTPSQLQVLRRLARPNDRPGANLPAGCHYLRGRGPLASAQVLARLGLARLVGPGWFNGEHWRITDEGREALALLEEGSS